MPLFITGDSQGEIGDGEPRVIEAQCVEDAIAAYIAQACQEELFKEYVYQRSVNMCWSEQFWLDDGDCEKVVSEKVFQDRVRKFFFNEPDGTGEWARLFLDSWTEVKPGTEEEVAEYKTVEFPHEMLIYMWVNSDYCSVMAFPANVTKA